MSTITTYLENKDIRRTSTFVYSPNYESYWLVNGTKYSEDEFERSFPLPAILKPENVKGGNPDRTKNWMTNKQSW